LGLRSDFRGNAFPGAAELLTLADDLEEMKTICASARKASMNLRFDASGRRVTAASGC
jgi:thymidine kinase